MDIDDDVVVTGEEGEPTSEQIAKIPQYDGKIPIVLSDVNTKVICRLIMKHSGPMLAGSTPEYEHIQTVLENKAGMRGDQQPRFAFAKMKTDFFIDEGTFGKVFKGSFGAKDVAIKQLKTTCQMASVMKERDILIYLKHPNIVNLVGAFHDDGTYLLFDLCYENLRQSAEIIPPRMKVKFGYQLLEGLRWIHSKNVVHCDLRPDNVFITLQNNLVIGDFGCAQLLPEGSDYVSTGSRVSVPAYSDQLANERFSYGKSSDIFAAACILFEMDVVKKSLLRYYVQDELVPLEEYIRAFKDGRIIGLRRNKFGEFDWDSQDLKREQLFVRAGQSTLFGPLIRMMVAKTLSRVTADVALNHACWDTHFMKYKFDKQNLSQDTERFCEAHRKILTEKLIPLRRSTVTNLYMQNIYYDEELQEGDRATTSRTSRDPMSVQDLLTEKIKAGIGLLGQETVDKASGVMCIPFGDIGRGPATLAGCVIPLLGNNREGVQIRGGDLRLGVKGRDQSKDSGGSVGDKPDDPKGHTSSQGRNKSKPTTSVEADLDSYMGGNIIQPGKRNSTVSASPTNSNNSSKQMPPPPQLPPPPPPVYLPPPPPVYNPPAGRVAGRKYRNPTPPVKPNGRHSVVLTKGGDNPFNKPAAPTKAKQTPSAISKKAAEAATKRKKSSPDSDSEKAAKKKKSSPGKVLEPPVQARPEESKTQKKVSVKKVSPKAGSSKNLEPLPLSAKKNTNNNSESESLGDYFCTDCNFAHKEEHVVMNHKLRCKVRLERKKLEKNMK